jgi:hypothetical protein
MPYIGNVVTGFNVGTQNINNGAVTGEKLSQPFNYDSGTLYLDDTNNRVGILTASPTSTLTIGTGGVLSIPLGAAATPSLIFGTDTNTGIYSPGADQLALSTGGTGRLFVASDGKIGCGIAAPSYGLQLINSASSFALGETGTNVRLVLNYASPTSSTAAPTITSDGEGLYYFGRNGYAGQHVFYSGTSNTERMRLDFSGRLGLGTSSPGAKLQVSQNTDAGTAISVVSASASTGLTTDYATLFLQNTNTTNNNYNAIGFVNDQGGYSSAIYGIYTSHTSGAQSGALAFSTRNAGTFDERMRITAAGNVGIGTNSVSTKLHIVSNGAGGDVWVANGSGQNCLLEMAGNGNTPQTNSALYGQDSSNNVYAGWARGAHPVLFGTNGTERGRWDSSGRFLVGTSSSLGNGIIQARANSDSSTGEGILLLAKGDSATAGQNLGQIKFTNSSGNQAAYITGIADTGWGGAGSADYPGALTFATTADGANSPTERMRIDNKGSLALWTPGNTTAGPQDVDSRIFAYNDGTNSSLYIDSRRSDAFVHINQTFADTANRGAIAFYRSESQKGSISIDSSQVYYNTTSDYRLKENIAPLSDALQKVEQLKPSVFNFIADPDRTVHGFIAHEVQAVVPEAVVGEKDAVDDDGNPIYQGIDQSKLVPLLTAALQEAIAKIETLEAKVAALEGV